VSRSERPSLRHAPGHFETLKDDVCHVGADLKKRGWRREVGASFSGLEAFYLSDAEDAGARSSCGADVERGFSTHDIVVSPASTLHWTDVLIGGCSSV
jgi:hypothetical protein